MNWTGGHGACAPGRGRRVQSHAAVAGADAGWHGLAASLTR